MRKTHRHSVKWDCLAVHWIEKFTSDEIFGAHISFVRMDDLKYDFNDYEDN